MSMAAESGTRPLILSEGGRVRPTSDLVADRPELEGQVGEVEWLEPDDDQVVVRWPGLPKLYRVLAKNLEPERG